MPAARHVVRDTMLVFRRAMCLSLRNPTWVIIGLTQPVLYLALFGPLLRHLPLSGPAATPAGNWRIFVPGLLVQPGIFGAAIVGFGLVAEYRHPGGRGTAVRPAGTGRRRVRRRRASAAGGNGAGGAGRAAGSAARKAACGRPPPWTQWWDEDDVAPMFPDPQTRAAVTAGQPRLPLASYQQQVPVPAG